MNQPVMTYTHTHRDTAVVFSTDTQHNREAMKKSPRWPKNREDCLKTAASSQGAGGMNFFLSFRKNDKKVFTKKKKRSPEREISKSCKAAMCSLLHGRISSGGKVDDGRRLGIENN